MTVLRNSSISGPLTITLWHTPESKQTAADLFTTQCYIKGEELMTGHEAEIRQLVVDWENGDEENRQLWKHVLSYSYARHVQNLGETR
jgi:arginyl-tRNA synthetase